MKKIIIVLVFVLGLYGAGYFEHNYTRAECEVTHKNDTVLEFTDKVGFVWSWYAETEEDFAIYNALELGDKASIKMFDNYSSAYIGDDIITKVVIR